MNDDEGENSIGGENEERKAEKPDAIEASGGLCKTQPAKGQWEGNHAREQDAPKNALMRQPAIEAALANKALCEEIADSRWNQRAIAAEVGIGEEELPASAPVASGWWT